MLDFRMVRVKTERAGGHLQIQTNPGRGVTTRLSMPLDQKSPAAGT
jgi:chemotaxis protein histidine kinase CheA